MKKRKLFWIILLGICTIFTKRVTFAETGGENSEEGFKVIEKNLETGETRTIIIPDMCSTEEEMKQSSSKNTASELALNVLKGTRVVFGDDSRIRVGLEDTNMLPFSPIGMLRGRLEGDPGYSSATAFMVGPDTAVTAAHNFYYIDGRYLKDITFTPGKNGYSAPFGMTSVEGFVYYPQQWADSFDREYDWAVFKTSSDIGNSCGWLGFMKATNLELENQLAVLSGYPTMYTKQDGYGEQWFTEDRILLASDLQIYYQMDTSGGNSGSPLIRYIDDFYVVGINSREYPSGDPSFNAGARINEDFYNMIAYYKTK